MTTLWWRVGPYGMAEAHDDTPAIRARVDTEHGWYGNIEGCILHRDVQATAYTREHVQLYDASAWLYRDEHVPTGWRTTIRNSITGEVIKQWETEE